MQKTIVIITNLLEILGLALVVAGVWLAFGPAVALIVAGVLVIGVSFLITTRTRGGRS